MKKIILISLYVLFISINPSNAQELKKEVLGVLQGEKYEYKYTKTWDIMGKEPYVVVERTDTIENEKDYLPFINDYYYVKGDNTPIRGFVARYMETMAPTAPLNYLAYDLFCHLSGKVLKIAFIYRLQENFPEILPVKYFELLETCIFRDMLFDIERDEKNEIPAGMNIEGIHIFQSTDLRD
jgi:hypothetical protein